MVVMILREKYYMPLVDVKDFTALIDNKSFFFDHPVKKQKKTKTKQEEDEQLIEMSRNDDCTAGKVLVYLYYENIINSLTQIYQDKKIRVLLKQLVL